MSGEYVVRGGTVVPSTVECSHTFLVVAGRSRPSQTVEHVATQPGSSGKHSP